MVARLAIMLRSLEKKKSLFQYDICNKPSVRGPLRSSSDLIAAFTTRRSLTAAA